MNGARTPGRSWRHYLVSLGIALGAAFGATFGVLLGNLNFGVALASLPVCWSGRWLTFSKRHSSDPCRGWRPGHAPE
jgi:hypothetical protein